MHTEDLSARSFHYLSPSIVSIGIDIEGYFFEEKRVTALDFGWDSLPFHTTPHHTATDGVLCRVVYLRRFLLTIDVRSMTSDLSKANPQIIELGSNKITTILF